MKRKGLGSLSVRKRRRFLGNEAKEEPNQNVSNPELKFLQQKCESEEELAKAKQSFFPFSLVSDIVLDEIDLLPLPRSLIQFEKSQWAPKMFGFDESALPATVGFLKHAFLKKHALKSVRKSVV